jgi:FkbM family methyltransferase
MKMKDVYESMKKKLMLKVYNRVKPSNLRSYYGQFGEDTALQTYFIGKMWNETSEYEVKTEGFYVDIGAFSPILISNTYWFYQHGWRGINVEPFPEVIAKFNALRPRDINISCAMGYKSGIDKYYSWGNSNLNTFSMEKVNDYLSRGLAKEKPTVLEIEMMKLEELFDRHLPKGQKIDFISIDVEGLDLDVLKSNNWGKYRPELVVVELDAGNIEEVINSQLYDYMIGNDFKLYYWLSPALIFVNALK